MLDHRPPTEYIPERSKWPRGRTVFFIIIILLLGAGMYRFGATKYSIAIENPLLHFLYGQPAPVTDKNYVTPEKDDNRLDVLILGIRGQNDPDAVDGGPLLTDSIEVFSFDKTTHKSSLVSIPRDMFVMIHDDKKDKLNAAYEYGVDHTGDSLRFIEDKISQITGIYIDKVIVFDFSSFKDIVDALGGIDITLDKPFSESQQWGDSFSLPAGLNHLDGQSALYYARSRYSTSDFDRSRRQQQIMFAVKDKLLKLNFIGNPVKTFSILNIVRNDIHTDISIWDLKQFLDLTHQVNFAGIKRSVLSTDNLLLESRGPDNTYILLPKTGDFSEIKQLFQDILK